VAVQPFFIKTMPTCLLVAFAWTLSPAPVQAQKGDAASSLVDLVPADAFFFAHARLGDLRASPWFKLLPAHARRDLSSDGFPFSAIGPIDEVILVVNSPERFFGLGGRPSKKATAAVKDNPATESKGPPPSKELPPKKESCGDKKEDEKEDEAAGPLLLYRFAKKIDVTKLGGKKPLDKGIPGAVLYDTRSGALLVFPDQQTAAFAELATLERFALSKKGHKAVAQLPLKDYVFAVGAAPGPGHAAALQRLLDDEDRHGFGFFVRGVLAPLTGLDSGALALALGDQPQLQACGVFSAGRAAQKGAWAVEDALTLIRLVVLPSIERDMDYERRRAFTPEKELEFANLAVLLEEAVPALRHAKVALDDKTVRAQVNLAVTVEQVRQRSAAHLKTLASDPKVRAARLRAVNQDKLKMIGLALHSVHDVHMQLPPQAICDKKTGKPLLSWRVAILPYIEQDALYRQFKLDEPWDSPHNLKLLDNMPDTYEAAGVEAKIKGGTFWQVFDGKHTMFEMRPGPSAFGARGIRISEVLDGLSNTLMVVEAGTAVPWTKPQDIPFDPEAKNAPKLGGVSKGGFNALYGDGSVRFHRLPLDAAVLRLLIMRNDGNAIPEID
jgi:hypothetical protein